MVTGGAGYIGSRLVPALVAAGHRVRVIDSLIFGVQGLQTVNDKVELLSIDIRDVQPGHFNGIDAVIHLAGISNDPTADFDPLLNEEINFRATVKLAAQARECGVARFIFASSCSVYYSNRPDNRLCNEQTDIAPKAAYSWSKYEAEKGVLALAGNDFCPVALRQGTLFGCSGRMRFDLVVNTFTLHAYNSGKLCVNAGGQMWRPLLYIEDAVNVYLRMLEAPAKKINGKIFNVLNDNYQVMDIARKIQDILQHKKTVTLELKNVNDVRSYRVCGAKLQQALDITMAHDITPAVEQMWALVENGGNFSDPVYYNIRWLEKNCMGARI